jgi:hypothetical protein
MIFTPNTPQEQEGDFGNISIGVGGYNFDIASIESKARNVQEIMLI